MSASIQNQNIQAQSFATQHTSATQSASHTGSLMGHQVTMANDPMSLLSQCAEELTFSVDTTDEFEMEERKEKEVTELKTSELYELYRKISEGGQDNQDKANLKNDIKAMQGSRNADTLAKLARDLAGNAAEAYIALQDAYEDLKKEGADPALLKSLDEAISLVETRDKDEIVACMQAEVTANTDPAFADLKDRASFYVTSTQEFTSTKEVYTYIQENYADKLDTALDFLYRTLANDLETDMSSMEKSKLSSIGTSLSELRFFQSAHALCDKFAERLETIHDIKGLPYSGFEVMGKVLDWKAQNYLGSSAIAAFAKEAKPQNPEENVLVLQELLSTTRQFSNTLFENHNERIKLLDAVQDAVNDAIAEEDAWLESMEE